MGAVQGPPPGRMRTGLLRGLVSGPRARCSSASARPLWGSPPAAADPGQAVELTVDGLTLRVPPGTTLMQAAALVGVDVPRFCYHERLKIAGNCRMCLVQVNGGPKLVASCAAPAAPGMRVETASAPVRKAREGVMEFLLANHPLDCPVCDQGGECDLQEQAMAFGSDRSRFPIATTAKRAVADKDFGPLVKTSMNRCIHCTRCVRFANELAGVPELGTTGRGQDMQITTYIERALDSELSGNLVDLCPVGALTSKPGAFVARPWELRRTESVDVMDAVGASIRVDSRGPEVVRVLPRLNEAVNEEWLADKSRFACDGLRQQRLTVPLLRTAAGLGPATWEQALVTAATKLRSADPARVRAVLGPFVDMETVLVLRGLLGQLGCTDLRFDGAPGAPLCTACPALYRLNAGIRGLEDADAVLLLGTNPRAEAPLVNARIRKAFLKGPLPIGLVGEAPPKGLTYEYEHLGRTVGDMGGLAAGAFWQHFRQAKRPAIVVGQAVYDAGAYAQLHALVRDLGPALVRDGWNGFSFLPLEASRTGALALGWMPGAAGSAPPELVYLVGAEATADIPADAFVIYQGHHGDAGAQRADVVLPGQAYTEKAASYMNMEGRVQRTRVAVPGPGDSRPDWQIARALAEVTGCEVAIDDPAAAVAGLEGPAGGAGLEAELARLAAGHRADPGAVLRSPVADYYLTDSISRASPTMAACSRAFSRRA